VKYFDILSKLDAQARFLGLTTLALGIALLFMSFTVFSLYSKKTVVVLPPKVDREFWVSGDTLSTSYLEQVAYFVADRVLSVSPANVDASLEMVKYFFSTNPDEVKELEKLFVKIAKTIRENDYYQVFYPFRFHVDKKQSKMVVLGEVRKMSGNQYIGTRRVSVEIFFRVRNGRLYITALKVS